MFTKKFNVLGTEYTAFFEFDWEDSNFEAMSCEGYTSPLVSSIYISLSDMSKTLLTMEEEIARVKIVLRHEIVHAFLYESGLDNCAMPFQFAWSQNEEMVDWFGKQGEKIVECFKIAEEGLEREIKDADNKVTIGFTTEPVEDITAIVPKETLEEVDKIAKEKMGNKTEHKKGKEND